MICILHGYLLEGSGSNLWTRSMIEALCDLGETVHLVAQENHPERYDFITEARRYGEDGSVEVFHRAERRREGCCVLHKPEIGETLPVYVRDHYEEFTDVVPMVDLSDEVLDAYVARNVAALLRVVEENGVTAIHANHAVLMSVVAQRVSEATGVPYAIMPHGSALEYAVRRDRRLHRRAREAFAGADRVFVIGQEMRERVLRVFPDLPGLEGKLSELNLGVHTREFQPVERVERQGNLARLRESLEGLPRGKRPEQTRALLERASADMDAQALRARFAEAAAYDGKAPDAGLEERLEAVDWAGDRTLLFVGRLIAAKGIQMVVAALPLLLERVPELRLVVVGHGPLREPLELLVHALGTGDRALAERVAEVGRIAEHGEGDEGEPTELAAVRRFWDELAREGGLDAYFDLAARRLRPDRVLFTGYLTHRELRWLFPCFDAAVFPSRVREAGPLVFLEALSSGVFPLGTDFGGMKASIDAIAPSLPPGEADLMRLDPDPARTTADIAAKTPRALELADSRRAALHEVAAATYDWRNVARRFARQLDDLPARGVRRRVS